MRKYSSFGYELAISYYLWMHIIIQLHHESS